MAKIMKPSLRQASTFEHAMEFLGDGGPIEGCPNWGREDQSSVMPVAGCPLPLALLAVVVFPQCLTDHRRHRESSATVFSLGLDELWGSMNPLQLLADAHVSHCKVDVLPRKPKCFALPQSHRERDRVESLKAIPSHGLE